MKVHIETPADVAADTGGIAPDAFVRDRIIHALRGVMDPELPVNLYDLGLIYELDISPANTVHVVMTLTAPNCPVAGEMPQMVQAAIMKVDGIAACTVKLVFDPPWDKSKLSEAARLELGLM